MKEDEKVGNDDTSHDKPLLRMASYDFACERIMTLRMTSCCFAHIVITTKKRKKDP